MSKKVVIADVHVQTQEHLKALDSFLNTVMPGNNALFFIGNGIEYVYNQPQDDCMKIIEDTIGNFPGSVMVRGNHDRIHPIGQVIKPGYNFDNMPIYLVEDRVLLTHNIDTMVQPWNGEISQDYPLMEIIFDESKRALKGRPFVDSIRPVQKNELGNLVNILENVSDRQVKNKTNKDYLGKVLSAIVSQGANLSFTGHEHCIDEDTTMFFELGKTPEWGLLKAGEEYSLADGTRYAFVAPHFRGIPHVRIDIPLKEVHYLEYDPAEKKIVYDKLSI